jgi:iron complex transport system permease protein
MKDELVAKRVKPIEITKMIPINKLKGIFKKEKFVVSLLFIALILVMLFSLTVGRFEISYDYLFQTILAKITNNVTPDLDQFATIIFKVRLPRVLASVCIGGALSISGATYQSMFKNPMVSPDILGVSSGAGFGAALGILIGMSQLQIQFMAFVFGLFAVLITCSISASVGKFGNKIIVLVLSGMVIRTVFQSLISITKYLADPDDALPAITFWLMGSLSSVELKDALIIGVGTILGIIPILWYRWKLNVIAFGDEEASAMGIDTVKLRRVMIITSTIITSVSISVCGMIGWVGLIIPHFSRMLVGPNNKVLIPTSLLLGAIYLLMMDNIARNLMSVEIPISILTSIVGAPFFVLLLLKTRRCW